jgi:signal transduction histidine kinase
MVRIPVRAVGVSTLRSGRRLAAQAVAASLGAALLSAFSLAPFWTMNPATGVINLLVSVSLVATAVVLAESPAHRRTAATLALAAPFWLISWWWAWPHEWQIGPVALLSSVTGFLWFVLGGIGMLCYPEPQLLRLERMYFVGLVVWICGGKLLLAAVSEPGWNERYNPSSWWPTVSPDRELHASLTDVFNVGVIVLAAVMMLLLIAKWRRSRGMDRLDSIPVTVAICSVTIIGGVYFTARLVDSSPQVIQALQTAIGASALVTPLAFLMVVVQRRLSRAAVADLIVAIAGAPTVAAVQAELRRALQDPTLAVWVRDPAGATFVATDGATAERPQTTGDWSVTACASDGAVLAVLVLDEQLQRHQPLVEAVAVAAGLALEVQARLAEALRSRERIASAADVERRRLERDLHDGAQQSLLAVAARLSTAAVRASRGRDAGDQIDQARDALQVALQELRQLARGIHPAVLSQSGLLPAVEGVAEGLPVPVVLDVEYRRWSDRVESTAYFLACEALTNVVRHANARRVVVCARQCPDGLEITVTDDGDGGADLAKGTGLAGMRDRVRAIGGELYIEQAAGGGTRVRALIPCE